MAFVFLSHSSKDKPFARKLSQDLKRMGHDVWLDEAKILVGESIVTSVQRSVDVADFVILVLSRSSVESGWVEQEWQTKYWDEIGRKRIALLPILLEDCDVPPLLRHRKYADFRGISRYVSGIVDLAYSIRQSHGEAGIQSFYPDVIDADCWTNLFQHSHSLDLMIMYSATWRNTYHKYIQELLIKPNGQLRVILPDLEEDSALLELYSSRLQISPTQMISNVSNARNDFERMGAGNSVEVWMLKKYFNHAAYIFHDRAVLALYSFREERVSTPAFLLGEGRLSEFLRQDFQWLISGRDHNCHKVYPSS